jgi:hypothetical protein
MPTHARSRLARLACTPLLLVAAGAGSEIGIEVWLPTTGWSDPGIPPGGTIRYGDSVRDTLGTVAVCDGRGDNNDSGASVAAEPQQPAALTRTLS